MTTITLPRATVEQALEALEKTMNVWGGTCAWHSDVKHAITNLRAALAQQAEPVAPGAWVASKDGRLIYDYDFTHDVSLRVMGDFEDDEQRVRYAQRIVDKLNAAPPQRTMAPLTEEEIAALVRAEIEALPSYPSAVEELPYRLARAVKKAVWEKNHGQA